MAGYVVFGLAVAVLSSVVTLVIAQAVYRRVWQPQLEARLLLLQQQFEEHVRRGVLAAGQELLPAFRQNVADGFRDALRDLPPVAVAGDAAKVVGGAADLLGAGLQNLFGLKPRK